MKACTAGCVDDETNGNRKRKDTERNHDNTKVDAAISEANTSHERTGQQMDPYTRPIIEDQPICRLSSVIHHPSLSIQAPSIPLTPKAIIGPMQSCPFLLSPKKRVR